MKCKVLLLAVLMTTMGVHGQNLVPNPSFEEYTICPSNPVDSVEIEKAIPWKSYRQTPDFFHPCDETGVMSSPYASSYGYGIPYHGIGKAGFIGIGGTLNREIIGVKLTDTLEVGSDYYVSFQLLRTFGGTAHSNCDCATNNIGVKFTTQAYSITETIPIDNQAHIIREEVLADSTNWTEISGWVTADSSYSHLAIGVFFDNDNVTVENYNDYQFLPKAYYFLDAVCVTADPADCASLNTVGLGDLKRQLEIRLYPNPTSSVINIKSELDIHEFRILDMTGRVLDEGDLLSRTSIDVSKLPKGLYVVMVRFENGQQEISSFIKQ